MRKTLTRIEYNAWAWLQGHTPGPLHIDENGAVRFDKHGIEFYLGQLVSYDVFPHGTNILGTAWPHGIESIGQARANFQLTGTSPMCEWSQVDDVKLIDIIRRK